MPKFSQFRIFGAFAVLALLSACAGKPQLTAQQESGQYRSRAARSYTPPGPASDPWGPYIVEAAEKYDVPQRWIREVMRQESGGRMYQNGALITSGPGAMGLMQVMPGTYDELRGRYPDLGSDAYDPHDNIMAGTAYIRELYDIYGAPGFLAAYNAGPGRLDDYLTRGRNLPNETRRYVAAIGPRIANDAPSRTSPGATYAMNSVPSLIPEGSRYTSDDRYSGVPLTPTALAPVRVSEPLPEPPRQVVQVAALPEPPRPTAAPSIVLGQPTPYQQFASLSPPPSALGQIQLGQPTPMPSTARAAAPVPQVAYYEPPAHAGFRLVAPAMAEPLIRGHATAGNWAVQVGAVANDRLAAAAITTAKEQAREALASAHGSVSSVRQGTVTLYRARLNGLSHEGAQVACERLIRQRMNCILVSPDAQS